MTAPQILHERYDRPFSHRIVPGLLIAAGLATALAALPTDGTAPDIARLTAGLLWGAAALAIARGGAWHTALRGSGRTTVAVTAAGLVWAVLVASLYVLPAGQGLVGRYFADISGTTEPVHEVADRVPSARQIVERWGPQQPPAFRVVWSGFVSVIEPGDYRFSLTSDDDAWLYIDEALIVDNGSGPHGAITSEGSARMARGGHRIRLVYVQRGGDLALQWRWARADRPYEPVPEWALSPRRVPEASVVAARALSTFVPWLGLCAAAGAVWKGGRAVQVPWRRIARRIKTSDKWLGIEPLTALLAGVVYAAVFLLPPGAGLYRDTVNAATDLTRAVGAAIARPAVFASNIDTPGAGREEAVPAAALRAVALLERHGQDRYRLSDAIRANEWLYQQTVVSTWPRRLEGDATAMLLLSDETMPPPCRPVDREGEVVLAACR
jgi:hypothetical protein